MYRVFLPAVGCLAACAAFVAWGFANGQYRGDVSLASLPMLGGCVVASFVAVIAAGAIFQATTAKVGHDVGLIESTALAVVSTAISLVMPFHGGTAVRALYLKRRHGLDLSTFAATFIGYNVLRLIVASTAVLVAATYLAASGRLGDTDSLRNLAVLAAAIAAGATAACFLRPSWISRAITPYYERLAATRVGGAVIRIHDGWEELNRCPWFLAKLFGLVLAQLTAEVATVWTAWAAVGTALPPAAAVLVTACGALAALTGLTPGGLGLVELVTTAVGTTVAVDPVHGMAASVLARLVSVVVLGVVMPFAMLRLFHNRSLSDEATSDVTPSTAKR
jgi:uncharacterized protein (TIRG00374 family)